MTLAQTWYGHFSIEHNRGHHVRVATPEDPASARFGETFWEFLPRSVLAPNLSSGYASMIMLTYLPPWRKVMDHRVLGHYDGDITPVNIHPRRRAKTLAKCGMSA